MAFAMARQQFLSDAVTVVMGQYVHRSMHLQVVQQCLLQIGLFHETVLVAAGFG